MTGQLPPDCGAGDGVDCRQVLADVYLYLDGQLDEVRLEVLRGHLDACAPCLREYGVEEHVRVLVSRSCKGDHAPEHLRTRVMAQLTSFMVDFPEP